MRYKEFCSIVESQIEGIDINDRSVSSFVRGAYSRIPEGSTPEQQQAYAEVWASGYQSGRLGANMSSRELFSGLRRTLVEKP